MFECKYKKWEQWELDYLIENYGNLSYNEMAKALKRDEKAIRNKVYYERKKSNK